MNKTAKINNIITNNVFINYISDNKDSETYSYPLSLK